MLRWLLAKLKRDVDEWFEDLLLHPPHSLSRTLIRLLSEVHHLQDEHLVSGDDRRSSYAPGFAQHPATLNGGLITMNPVGLLRGKVASVVR